MEDLKMKKKTILALFLALVMLVVPPLRKPAEAQLRQRLLLQRQLLQKARALLQQVHPAILQPLN
jgi:hypothetical protein